MLPLSKGALDLHNLPPTPPSRAGRGTGRGERTGLPFTCSKRDEVPHPLLLLGAGVTPAQGGAEPTVGSAFNKVIFLLSATSCWRFHWELGVALGGEVVVQVRAQI